jgi:polyhydroxybutyrate depolymerase
LGRALRSILLTLLAAVLLLTTSVYLAFGPSLRCTLPSTGPATSGVSARTVFSGGADRCYLLYVPTPFDPRTRIPVLFALHGLAGNPQGFRAMTGWEEIADRETFLVVYPQGSSFPLRWNTSPAFHIEQTDDVQFIADVLEDLPNVDERRVYVTGFSNGAGMADQIACALAGRIAAVGVVEGKNEDDPSRCLPARPVPVIGFFGTEDPLASAEFPQWFYDAMNLSSDPQYQVGVPVEAWAEAWATRNGCDRSPRELPRVGDAAVTEYGQCRDGANVLLYRIEGGGHTWPGGTNLLPFLGEASTLVNASEIMWHFFEDHLLPNAP